MRALNGDLENFTIPPNCACQLEPIGYTRSQIAFFLVGGVLADDANGTTSGFAVRRSPYRLRDGLLWRYAKSQLLPVLAANRRSGADTRQTDWAGLLRQFRSARRRSGRRAGD